MLISLIIATYNRPNMLGLVLEGLVSQTNSKFEIVIADDGSTQETKHVVEQYRKCFAYPLQYVWQPDQGFRLARIRNIAVLRATGDYFVFLDGDCVPDRHFIEQHYRLAEPNWLVRGSRILLGKEITQEVLGNKYPLWKRSFAWWFIQYLKGRVNKPKWYFPCMSFPCMLLRKLRHKKWRGATGFNLAIYCTDFYAVNGFDEKFTGWGCEDADFVIRLLNHGVLRKDGNYATVVFHLWHPIIKSDKNFSLLFDIIGSTKIRAEIGLIQHEEKSY